MQWCRIFYHTSLQVPSCFFTFFHFKPTTFPFLMFFIYKKHYYCNCRPLKKQVHHAIVMMLHVFVGLCIHVHACMHVMIKQVLPKLKINTYIVQQSSWYQKNYLKINCNRMSAGSVQIAS